MTGQQPAGPEHYSEEQLANMSEEELKQLYLDQYNAEMRQVRVQDLVAQSLITLVNIGARRAGIVPGTEDERDREQLGIAIEAARALLPLAEPGLGADAAAVRDALSQLQLAYVRAGGPPPAPGETDAGATPGGPGPAQSSGRLWVPGQ